MPWHCNLWHFSHSDANVIVVITDFAGTANIRADGLSWCSNLIHLVTELRYKHSPPPHLGPLSASLSPNIELIHPAGSFSTKPNSSQNGPLGNILYPCLFPQQSTHYLFLKITQNHISVKQQEGVSVHIACSLIVTNCYIYCILITHV